MLTSSRPAGRTSADSSCCYLLSAPPGPADSRTSWNPSAESNGSARAGWRVSGSNVTMNIAGLNRPIFLIFFYLPKDLIRSAIRKYEKIDFHGRGYLEWQTSLSITPAFSHPSLCALAKRHPRPKQCDLWEAFPPLRPSAHPTQRPPTPQSVGHFLFV